MAKTQFYSPASPSLTGQAIANEFLRLLASLLRDKGHTEYADMGPRRVGDTVRWRSWMAKNRSWSPPELILLNHCSTDVELDPQALALSLDVFSMRYIVTAALDLARQVVEIWPRGATMITAAMHTPLGVYWSHTAFDWVSGLAVLVLCAYDAVRGVDVLHFDMLFGFTAGVPYVPSDLECGAIALLLEARYLYTARLAELKAAA